MGMYWGAKLFFGCAIEGNPLYGGYNPDSYEYEFDDPFDEIQDLVAFRDKIHIPDPWDLVETEGRSYDEYSKDTAYVEAKAERDYIYGQLNARIPLSVEKDYDDSIYIVKGYYYSTYQNEILTITKLENPPQEKIKECEDFCAKYGLPPFVDYGWKLQGDIEH